MQDMIEKQLKENPRATKWHNAELDLSDSRRDRMTFSPSSSFEEFYSLIEID